MTSLLQAAWPRARLAEAIDALARHAGLAPRALERPPQPPAGDDDRALARWVEDVAAWIGVEAEPIETSHADLEKMIAGASPALLRVLGEARFFAVISSSGGVVTLLAPDERRVRARVHEVAAVVAAEMEAELGPAIDGLLARASIPPRRRPAARRALLTARLGGRTIDGCFMLGLPARASLLRHARRAGLGRTAALFLAATAASYALFLGAWSLVGAGALSGRVDRGWLAAWAWLLITQVPLRVLASWSGGRLAIQVGALVKQRLLAGALALDADAVRVAGAGQLFGRVVESEALDALALGGGVAGLIALMELGFAILVLALGVAGVAHVLAIAATVALSVGIALRFYRARARWTERRLAMTHDLVERMVGQRTRLAQGAPERWHEGEDGAVAEYLESSARMDGLSVLLNGALPRGFFLVGIGLLAPAFVGDVAPGPLAVSLGGLLLARGALARFSAGLADLAGAAIAWRSAAPLLSAASRAPSPPDPSLVARAASDEAVLDARELTFTRPGRAAPILAGASLTVREGDRLLLQGGSGSGKSTFGSILSGHLAPATGLLIVSGLDRHSLGPIGLRRSVVSAPQFHDNHVVSAPFAFNLLMGRAWPPAREDLQLADEICRELRLGPLLDRMPSGLFQMVGDTGWQLSHGEKSRLYIARALLQDASLVVLDESFGALDPETLEVAMSCVLSRARSLLVIAHP